MKRKLRGGKGKGGRMEEKGKQKETAMREVAVQKVQLLPCYHLFSMLVKASICLSKAL